MLALFWRFMHRYQIIKVSTFIRSDCFFADDMFVIVIFIVDD